MDLPLAQADMRRAHVNGGPGVLVSGLVWLIAGLIWIGAGAKTGFVALFIGGMAIAPLAQLLTKTLFKAPPSTTGKRLEWIAIASLPILLGGFYIGWRQIDTAPEAAIPLAAIGVGLRYLAFPLMFGSKLFLVLAGGFIALGWIGANGTVLPFSNVAVLLGLIELACAALLYRQWQPAGGES